MLRGDVTGFIVGDLRTPDEIREAVYLTVGDVQAKNSRFWLLLLLATGIATAGVISDSTATVIGAMIIAPLATPIQGVAVAIAFGESRELVKAGLTLLAAIAFTIAFAALLAWVLPQLEPLRQNSQVTARVSPTLLDLVAASFTGLAGSLAIARRDISDILPGVAIAISLVPPLAVVGVTAVGGDWSGALGALLLFVTNVLAIIVLGVTLFGAVRIRADGMPGRLARAHMLVLAAGVGVVAALGVSTYRTVQLFDWQQTATRIGSGWARGTGQRLIDARFDGDRLVFVVEGDSQTEHGRLLPALLKGALPAGTPVTVDQVSGAIVDVGTVPGD